MVNANQDPYLGDTSQAHETHTQAGTVGQFINSYVSQGLSDYCIAGRGYSFAPANVSMNSSAGWSQGTIYLARVDIEVTHTAGFDNVFIFLNSTAVGVNNFLVGIYSDNAGQPGTSLLWSVTFDCTATTGYRSVAIPGGPWKPTAGQTYWLTFLNPSGNANIPGIYGMTNIAVQRLGQTLSGGFGPPLCRELGSTEATLRASAAGSIISGGPVPLAWFRAL